MRKIICNFTLFGACLLFLVTQQAFAQCSNEDSIRIARSLSFRLELLDIDASRKALFWEAAFEHMEKLVALQSEFRMSNGDPAYTVAVCRETERISVIADDILSGGTGTGKLMLSPWKNHTPEEMFALHMRLIERCGEDFSGCETPEIAKLEMLRTGWFYDLQTGKLQYPAYVDKLTDYMQQALNNLEQ